MQNNEASQSAAAIRHRVEIESTPSALYAALTDPAKLAAWWTTRVNAEEKVDSIAKFTFGDGSHQTLMRIERLQPNAEVAWRCVSSPWEGMTLTFDIREHERGCVLLFTHAGWPEQSEFYMHCNAKWGFFLAVSLKGLLETGCGVPHPGEPKI